MLSRVKMDHVPNRNEKRERAPRITRIGEAAAKGNTECLAGRKIGEKRRESDQQRRFRERGKETEYMKFMKQGLQWILRHVT